MCDPSTSNNENSNDENNNNDDTTNNDKDAESQGVKLHTSIGHNDNAMVS